ncbi:MAG: hypothetical protein JO185_06130 [Acidobacteriaceae bacterium]|nr:hypothetical protein [Acidobacteriaceae bacterium]
MTPLPEDLVAGVIEKGIKHPISIVLQEHCYSAALVLTYSGMDTMAFLGMPSEKTYVMRSDFIAWTEHYVRSPFREEVSALDLYGARCSVLHGGAASRLSQSSECKTLRHSELQFEEPLSPKVVIAPVGELVRAFFAGIDQFLLDVSQDEKRAKSVGQRLRYLMETMPYVSETVDGKRG